MFYPLGKTKKNLMGGVPSTSPPPPLYVRGLNLNKMNKHVKKDSQ